MEEQKLEYTKMQERFDWAIDMLKKQADALNLKISDDSLFTQACEIAKTLFVRSEIQYSAKKH